MGHKEGTRIDALRNFVKMTRKKPLATWSMTRISEMEPSAGSGEMAICGGARPEETNGAPLHRSDSVRGQR